LFSHCRAVAGCTGVLPATARRSADQSTRSQSGWLASGQKQRVDAGRAMHGLARQRLQRGGGGMVGWQQQGAAAQAQRQ